MSGRPQRQAMFTISPFRRAATPGTTARQHNIGIHEKVYRTQFVFDATQQCRTGSGSDTSAAMAVIALAGECDGFGQLVH
jgi:hypothetical protein